MVTEQVEILYPDLPFLLDPIECKLRVKNINSTFSLPFDTVIVKNMCKMTKVRRIPNSLT